MADHLGLDPARIERLRRTDRLTSFDPARIWQVLDPAPGCTMLDIGTGVGFGGSGCFRNRGGPVHQGQMAR